MHDPLSLVKDVRIFGKHICSIWHKDPCSDGSDDSCGMFKRARHGNPEVLKRIQSDFEFEFKQNSWFTPDGIPKFSTIGILACMYRTAAWVHFKRNRKKMNRFMEKNLHSIIFLAENPVDCIGNSITDYFKYDDSRELINEHRRLASIVYGDILRKETRWWQHPKYHVHHWHITSRLFKRKKKANPNYDANLRATV